MHLLAAVYILILGAVLGCGIRSQYLQWPSTLIAMFLVVWATLILTAQVLSPLHALNELKTYILVSVAVAASAAIGLRLIPLRRDVVFQKFAYEYPKSIPAQSAQWLMWFFAITGVFVLFGNLILGYSFLPANPDSIVYRFPRVYWYFGQGSLFHFTNAAEPRPLFYPFNGSLAYLPLVLFQFGPRSFSVLSLLSWMIVGLTTYLFSLNLGGSKLAAAATAWLICLTPNVLLQALSTNDEIIAAAPLLAGLFFLHRWFQGRQIFDFVIGSLGLGISAGTKLHIAYYWPLIAIIALVLLQNHKALFREVKTWIEPPGIVALIVSLLLVAVFSFSFLVYNYTSSGLVWDWNFADQLLNKPFSIWTAIQTTTLYSAQIVLTPIADLFAMNPSTRGAHYELFNQLFAPLFRWVNNGPAYVSAFYQFTGINSREAVLFNEQTVFIGFTWLIWLIAAANLVWRAPPGSLWGCLHIASFPIWFVSFAASTRYIEGISVYLTYALIVCGPTLVFAFAPIENRKRNLLRWCTISFVVIATSVLSMGVFLTNPARNLGAVARAPSLPMSRGFAVDQIVQDEIAQAKAGIYDHSIAWEQPYWAFMAFHPEIRHYMPSNPTEVPGDPNESSVLRYSRYVLMPAVGDLHLHIYTFPQATAYGHAIPIRVPDKTAPGLTWIGDLLFALGPEWVFAAGNDVQSRHPDRDKYIVLTFNDIANFGHDELQFLDVASILYGLGAGDDLAFRYNLKIGGNTIDASDWKPTPDAHLKAAGLSSDNGVLEVFVRNENAGGTVSSISVPLRNTKPLGLLGLPQDLGGEFETYRKGLRTEEDKQGFDRKVRQLFLERGGDYVRGYVDGLRENVAR